MFHEDHIVLNFAVLSDMHMGGAWRLAEHEQRFKNAIQLCKRFAGGKLDAFLLNGDFTDAMNSPANVFVGNGHPEDYEEAKKQQNANEFRIIRSALATVDDETEILYTLGNHDGHMNRERFITEFSSRDKIGDNRNFKRMYRTDLDLQAMRKGVRHCVVGGYHILCLDVLSDYTEALALMKQWLDEITTADPETFVFVLYHYKVPNTVMFSDNSGTCPMVGELLRHYPQVVLLSGHTHSPLQNERAIWQGEYTVVETSCMRYLLNSSVPEVNVTGAMNCTQAHGLLMQLDDTGNLRILKLDLKKECTIGTPWELPKPKADLSHLKRYSNARANRYPAPRFPKNAKLSVVPKEEETAVSFPAAQHEDMVYRYEAVVTDISGKSQLFYISSLFCYDNPDRETVSAVLPHPCDAIYRLTVTPQDVWFNCGEPLHFNKYQ